MAKANASLAVYAFCFTINEPRNKIPQGTTNATCLYLFVIRFPSSLKKNQLKH